ncbi:AAA domain-containing protein [Thalassospira lucentensis]|uniref:DEAD/DEAH box helicase n=1 Tax=Thalassospira lucentensis TaxID=168935 RepID=UPI003AA988CB
MPRDPISPSNDLIFNVLDYWHKIEFFIPFDLKSRSDAALAQDKPARWLDYVQGALSLESLKNTELTPDKEIGGYTLFIGVFDKNEVTSLCEHISPAKKDEIIRTDDQERADIEGETCFAQIYLSADGEPAFENMAVSTLPWAIGKSRKHGLSFLSIDNFEADWQRLETQIYNFQSKREEEYRKRQEEDETLERNSISFSEIVELSELIADWAEFSPRADNRVAFMEMWVKEKRPQKQDANPSPPQLAINEDDELEDEDEDEAQDQVTEIGILNSFFIKDIERALHSILNNPEKTTNLHRYISQENPEKRTNLFDTEGQKEIIRRLSPTQKVRGRWFDEPHHMMSLMQQFSINTAFDELQENGIFSVNGPPGTGKTTLLREIFAENIVRRAEALASFNHARDTFEKNATSISVPDCYSNKYRPLKRELTGFEMVVVSANNAAVENISRELPQSGSIGDFWKSNEAPEYLKSIAYNIAATDGAGKFRHLPEDEMPWGLVSCVLGKAKNRTTFRNKFLFSAKVSHTKQKPHIAPLGLWDWLKNYAGLSFRDAREDFQKKKETLDLLKADLSTYESLIERFGKTSLQQFLSVSQEKYDSAQRAHRLLIEEQKAIRDKLNQVELTLRPLKEQERLLDREAPAWWEKLFATAAARRHKIDVRHNANEQRNITAKIASLNHELLGVIEPAVANAEDYLQKALVDLEAHRQEWQQAQAELDRFKAKYPDIKIPTFSHDIENDTFQIAGLWHTEEIAKARSELFQAALVLHEAWLAEAAGTKDNKGPFRDHINLMSAMLSSPNAITRQQDALAIWQSLFMMVPVVSTTFASFGNQFSALGRNALGWVFIDEAGQAPPQASVGALWRGKRVVAVGDPRQIEPVFTVPTTLIDALSEQSPDTQNGIYAPNKTSVQELADKWSKFGSYVDNGMGGTIWIGSPLRVHRRCIDPMFSIANKIAYEDNMVFGLPSHKKKQDISITQDSCWIDIKGSVRGKQTVDAQVSFVAEVIKNLAADGKLPQDIFVITPFKEIRQNLIKDLNEQVRIPNRFKKSQFDKWCRTSVGTVHTFQGKEADIVMFILGADHEHDGSAKWASSKPNLLNVALTRAKQRVFIAGDPSLWGQQKYFSTALKGLSKISENEFIERLQSQGRQL